MRLAREGGLECRPLVARLYLTLSRKCSRARAEAPSQRVRPGMSFGFHLVPTDAPRLASCLAMASPMPREAPVTTASLPRKGSA